MRRTRARFELCGGRSVVVSGRMNVNDRTVRRFWTLLALAGVSACGPSLGVDEGARFDAARTYVRALAPRANGQLYGVEQLISFTLFEDGTARTTIKRCVHDDDVGGFYSWSQDGDVVSLRATDVMEVFATLELEEDICELHSWSHATSNNSSGYYAGDYCVAKVHDNGHAGYSCDWEPCDEVAEGCAEWSP